MPESYQLLPFRFAKNNGRYLLTNEVGDYIYLDKETFKAFVSHQLQKSEEYFNLKSKFFLYDRSLDTIIDTLATRYRTRHRFLYEKTALHIFVVTLRCNQRCSYCHVASEGITALPQFDMDHRTAERSVEFAFQSPSPVIKIEFQGGEPLLNFDAVRVVVAHANLINEKYNKHVEFVICTNLIALNDEHLAFFRDNNFSISTSIDGTRDVHDSNRKLRNGSGSFDLVVENIKNVQAILGKDMVSALLTVTPQNLMHLRETIDLYVDLGLSYMFIRKLNPFGFAYNSPDLSYSNELYIQAYHDALEYIVELNKHGVFFSEAYATILLSRIMTPFSTGFVDLQSPTGAGLNGIVYDSNGDVFISDEARMFYRTTGDKKFCIGTVEQTREQVFSNPEYIKLVSNSIIDAYPGCAWCVFKPYCGSDPVRNYSYDHDIVGHRPTNSFCKKHLALFALLFDYLDKNNPEAEDVFWSWITNRSVSQVRSFSLTDSSSESK
jgi:uncharacterized protein